MLNGVSAQELANKNLIQQGDVEKVQSAKKNPYAAIDKNLLIDESSISSEAVALYQKDLDIKKFTSLALSNPEDNSHNVLAAENVFSGQDTEFDDKIIDEIFDSENFLKDLLG